MENEGFAEERTNLSLIENRMKDNKKLRKRKKKAETNPKVKEETKAQKAQPKGEKSTNTKNKTKKTGLKTVVVSPYEFNRFVTCLFLPFI
jgi:hypothetical protein